MYSSQPDTKNEYGLVPDLIKFSNIIEQKQEGKFIFPDNLLYFKYKNSSQVFKMSKSVEFVNKNV